MKWRTSKTESWRLPPSCPSGRRTVRTVCALPRDALPKKSGSVSTISNRALTFFAASSMAERSIKVGDTAAAPTPFTPTRISMRERSAPAASRRGQRVSPRSSSALRITTPPFLPRDPSGMGSPRVVRAAMSRAIVLFPRSAFTGSLGFRVGSWSSFVLPLFEFFEVFDNSASRVENDAPVRVEVARRSASFAAHSSEGVGLDAQEPSNGGGRRCSSRGMADKPPTVGADWNRVVREVTGLGSRPR